jgi:mycoredoxin
MGSGSPVSVASRRRCERHGLAVAPDGLCALCRSESLPPPHRHSTWALRALLVALLVASAGALAYRAVDSLRRAANSPKPAPASTPTDAAPAEPSLALDTVASRQVDPTSFVAPSPSPAAVAVDAAPAIQAQPPSVVEAAKPRPQPSQAELRAALTATPIVMYGTSWCGVCRTARRFLSENGLSYREIDPDATPTGWEKVQQLTGRRAVPVIVVDGDVQSGLSEQRVLDAATRSVERRLGVTGIRVVAQN